MKSKHKTSGIDKPESIGVLSNDKKSIAVDPQDEIVLSVSQDDIDRQSQSQERRLDALAPSESPSSSSAPTTTALQAFIARCDLTSDGEGYVDCVDGFVKDTTTTCATACGNTFYQDGGFWSGGKCCTGISSCGRIQSDGTISSGFTGKGKQRVIHLYIILVWCFYVVHESFLSCVSYHLHKPFPFFFSLVKFVKIGHVVLTLVLVLMLAQVQILIMLLVRLAQDLLVRAKVLKLVVLIRLAEIIPRVKMLNWVVLT